MSTRYIRSLKKCRPFTLCCDASIERVKKIRALNCDPSDIGMDNYMWKTLSVNRRSR